MGDLYASWERICDGLDLTVDAEHIGDQLLARHAEPQRRYHTLQHLGECLAWFETAQHLAQRPAEVEAALWFHDAVYDVRRDDNEARSAELARTTLRQCGAAADVADRVAALVDATRHAAEPTTADERLLVDIDLSILGADAARFAEYEQQIRDEYAHVPQPEFRERRAALLRALLARPRLYATAPFRALLEERARANLRHALAADGG
jgi:predicted metal-dependent HD superfamily phosphohydrolase